MAWLVERAAQARPKYPVVSVCTIGHERMKFGRGGCGSRHGGSPSSWIPGLDVQLGDFCVRQLVGEEKSAGRPTIYHQEKTTHRPALRRGDFPQHRFIDGRPGCQAMFAGSSSQGYSEAVS